MALVVTGIVPLRMMRARPVQSVEPTKFPIFAPPGVVFEQTPYIAVSPDGRFVVFFASSGGVVKLWVKLQANSGATPMAGTEGAMHPFWSPDSQFVAYFAAGGLWKVPAGGGRPEKIADAAPGEIQIASLDSGEAIVDTGIAGGKPMYSSGHLLYTTTNVNELALFNLDHGTGARRFTYAEGQDFFPVWSPDGLEVVFASTRNGRYQIYRKSADFSSPEVLVLDDSVAPRHLIAPTDWSRDGNFVAYTKSGPAKTEIWILPMSGSRAPFRFRQSPGNEGNAHFSPDGRWIAFKSDEGGERSEIYVAPFPGPGAVHQVSAAGGTQPSWSRNGQELFYFGPDGALMAATVEETAPAFKWSAARTLFAQPVNLTIGVGNEYAVNIDGSRFLINVLSPPQPLTVILDWLALARQ